MKKIVFMSQKGGSGKSTLAVSLACEAERQGKQTVIIDTDPQATAYKWAKARGTEIPFVVSVQPATVQEELDKFDKAGADWAIIDSAGHTSNASMVTAKQADVLFIPSRATSIDLNAIEESIDIAKIAGKSPFVLFNAVHHSASGIFAEVSDVVKNVFKTDVVPFYISQRTAYSHGLIDGGSPQEFEPNGKAQAELEKLYKFIDNLLTC